MQSACFISLHPRNLPTHISMHFFNHALQVAGPYLHHYGYFAIFLGTFVEGLGIPAPGLTMLVAASILAGRNDMNLTFVIGTAYLGAFLGYNGGYWWGTKGGHRLLLRTGLINRHHLVKVRKLYRRWGPLIIIIAPFFDGLRQLNGPVAGIIEISWFRFASAIFIGCLIWITFWSLTAYFLSEHAAYLYQWVSIFKPWLYLIATLLVLGLAVYLLASRKKGSAKQNMGNKK